MTTTRSPGATRRSGAAGASILIGLALALVACGGGRNDGPPPDVIVIVADTLRADRLGPYGAQRGLTPFLDELAARGTVFTNAYAPSSWTCPSIASLFTSRYPSQHGTTTFASTLSEDEHTLAELLARSGYATRGFTANFRINKSLGYGQGFTDLRSYLPRPGDPPKERAGVVNRDALAWLDGLAAAGDPRPRFLYLHYMEPHAPYDPPEPFRGRLQRGSGDAAAANQKVAEIRYKELTPGEVELLASLYDGEVAALDAELRALFTALAERGRLERTLVVVTSDHGEEFREHGLMTHGLTLFEESIRIPLLIVGPGVAAGQRLETPVSLLDVGPTILELAAAAAEPRFEGRSLVPHLTRRAWWDPRAWGAGEAPRDVFCELKPEEGPHDVRRHSEALIRHPNKLVIARSPIEMPLLVPDPGNPAYRLSGPQVYDLAADPGEQRAAPPQDVAAGEPLVRALAQWRAETGADAATPRPPQPLDDATKEKLRALGYDPGS